LSVVITPRRLNVTHQGAARGWPVVLRPVRATPCLHRWSFCILDCAMPLICYIIFTVCYNDVLQLFGNICFVCNCVVAGDGRFSLLVCSFLFCGTEFIVLLQFSFFSFIVFMLNKKKCNKSMKTCSNLLWLLLQ